jgi:hypothetical protein
LQVTSIHRVLQHRARAIVALVALTLAAFALAACGGDDGGSGSSGDAEALLRETFTGTHEMESGKVDLQLGIEAEGDDELRGPMSLRLSGPFQLKGDELPEVDLAVEVTAQGQSFDAGLTAVGGDLYVRFGGAAYEVPEQMAAELRRSYAEAQREGGGRNGLSLRSLGIDPLSWLSDPEIVGEEEVGGVKTQHITAEVDVPALLADVEDLLRQADEQGLGAAAGQEIPDRIPAETRKEIEEAVKEAEVDIWTGDDDHTLRRITLALVIEPADPDDGPTKADIDLSLELSGLTEPQTITPPSETRPLTELLGQLDGLLGGALGMGGGSGSDDGGATGEQLDRYTRCIEEAGTDVDKAQECAKLLTK